MGNYTGSKALRKVDTSGRAQARIEVRGGKHSHHGLVDSIAFAVNDNTLYKKVDTLVKGVDICFKQPSEKLK